MESAATYRHGILLRGLELLRFAVTGAVSVALNLVVIMFLTERLGFNYLVSVATCFVTVTFVSFWLNRTWTFRKGGTQVTRELGRYVIAVVIQLLLSLASMAICVEKFHVPYPVAVVVLSVAFVPITFLLHRRWSFNIRWSEQSS